MKNKKILTIFLSVIICIITCITSFFVFAYEGDYSGSSTGGSGSSTNVNGNFNLAYADYRDFVGFRFSFVDKDGNIKPNSQTVDLFLSNLYDYKNTAVGDEDYNLAYAFNGMRNKTQYIAVTKTDKYKDPTNLKVTYKSAKTCQDNETRLLDSKAGFSVYPSISSLSNLKTTTESWLKANNWKNLSQLLKKTFVEEQGNLDFLDIDDTLLIEPLFGARLDGKRVAFTITEFGVYSAAHYDNYNSKPKHPDDSGFVAKGYDVIGYFTSGIYSVAMYHNSSHLWSNATNSTAIKSGSDLINKGYGVNTLSTKSRYNIAQVNLKLNGSAWKRSNMNVTLKTSSKSIPMTYTTVGNDGFYRVSNKTKSNLTAGTYNVYANPYYGSTELVDTGVDITVAANSETKVSINYYTVQLTAGTGIKDVTITPSTGSDKWTATSGNKTTDKAFLYKYQVKISRTLKEGYTWTHWKELKNTSTYGAATYNNTIITQTERDFEAIARLNKLKVYYNANNGALNSNTYYLSSKNVYKTSDKAIYYQQWTYNSTQTNGLVNPSTFGMYRNGYVFNGWGTSTSGGTIFDPDDTSIKPTDLKNAIKTGDAEITLYAQWKPNKLTVQVKKDGKAWTGSGRDIRLYQNGKQITNGDLGTESGDSSKYIMNAIPNGTYDVYSALNNNSLAKYGSVTINNNSKTYTIDYYTLKLEVGNDGPKAAAITGAGVYRDDEKAKMYIPENSTGFKEGHIFNYWLRNDVDDISSNRKPNGYETPMEQPKTFKVYAKDNTLKVYYNANGGTPSNATVSGTKYYNKLVSSSNKNIIHSTSNSTTTAYYQTFTYDTANDLANASSFGLTRAGYKFTGWKDADGNPYDETTAYKPSVLNSDIKNYNENCTLTLYAQWEPYKLTIRYHSNYASSGKFEGKALDINDSVDKVVCTQTYNYDVTLSSGLANYNNPNYLYLDKIGHFAIDGAEWKTQEGKTVDHDKSYTSQALADALGCGSLATKDRVADVYVNWSPYKLTIHYMSNYATSGKLNGTKLNVSSSTNVEVLTGVYNYDVTCASGLANYNNSKSLYLDKTGHYVPSKAEWINVTKGDNSTISQTDKFDTAQAMATAYGWGDLSKGNIEATVKVNWVPYELKVEYYSNGATSGKYNGKTISGLSASENKLVVTGIYKYGTSASDGLGNYNGSWINLTKTGHYVPSGKHWINVTTPEKGPINHSDKFDTAQAMATAYGWGDLSKGNITAQVKVNWTPYELTVNYHSNYANQSFNNPLNPVDASKDVIVRTYTWKYANDNSNTHKLHKYTNISHKTYLGRSGYSATGIWKTEAGNEVHQDTIFLNPQDLAAALGAPIESQNQTVNVYAQWNPHKLTVYYHSNKADEAFPTAINPVSADKDVIVGYKTWTNSTSAPSPNSLHNYSTEGSSVHLAKSGYTFVATDKGNAYWNTKEDGTGIKISEATQFATLEAMANKLGTSIENSDAEVHVYPMWTPYATVNYYYLKNGNDVTLGNTTDYMVCSSSSCKKHVRVKDTSGNCVHAGNLAYDTKHSIVTDFNLTRPDHFFKGWKISYRPYNTSTKVYGNITYMDGLYTTGNLTLTDIFKTTGQSLDILKGYNRCHIFLEAQWEPLPNNATVTVKLNGTEWIDSTVTVELRKETESYPLIKNKGEANYISKEILDNGTYDIYASNSTGSIVPTGKTIKIENGKGKNHIEYFTLTTKIANGDNGINNTSPSYKICLYEEDVEIKADIKDHYEFNKWTGADNDPTDNPYTTTMTEKKDFVAHSRPVNYNYTFVTKGGTFTDNNSTANKSGTYTIEDVLKGFDISKTEYSFLGWKVTSTDGNWDEGKIYSSKTVLHNAAGMYGDVTFEAQWRSVKVYYNVNGGLISNTTDYKLNGDYIAKVDSDDSRYYLDLIELDDTNYTATSVDTFGLYRNGYAFNSWTIIVTAIKDDNELGSYTYQETKSDGCEIYVSDIQKTVNEYINANYDEVTIVNVELKANWNKNNYNYTFIPDGGTFVDDDSIASKLGTYTIEDILEGFNIARDDYSFLGWKVISTNGNWDKGKIYSSETVLHNNVGMYGDVTFKAQWKSLRVYYNLDGGSISNTTDYKINGNYIVNNNADDSHYFIDLIELNATSYNTISTDTFGLYNNGYTFGGWILTITAIEDGDKLGYYTYQDAKSNNFELSISDIEETVNNYIEENYDEVTVIEIEFKAKWVPNNYIVKYYLDGNEIPEYEQSLVYGGDDLYYCEFPETIDGCSINGWYQNDSYSSTKYNPNEKIVIDFNEVNEDNIIERHAETVPNTYDVKYYWINEDGDILSEIEIEEQYKTYTYGTGIVLPNIPQLEGYNVPNANTNNWYIDTEHSDTTTIINKETFGNKEFYAIKTPIRYTVKYFVDNEEQIDLKQDCLYGVEYTHPELPEKEMYLTIGWYDANKEYSQDPIIMPNSKFSNLGKTEGEIVEIHAYRKIIENEYKITYYWIDEPETPIAIDTYVSGTGTELITIEPIEGYDIDNVNTNNWYVDIEKTETKSNISNSEFGDKTFYAYKEPINYTVEYYLGGELLEDYTQGCIFNEYKNYKFHTLPTEPGYIITGWTDENDTYYKPDTVFTNNLTTESNGVIRLYAEKDPNTITISVNKDKEPWIDSDIVIEIWKDGEKVDTLTHNENTSDYIVEGVPNGTYDIYTTDSTGNTSKTDITIEINDNDVNEEVNYYTLTVEAGKGIENVSIINSENTSLTDAEMITHTFREGEKAYIDAPVIKDGYIWDGWTGTNTFEEQLNLVEMNEPKHYIANTDSNTITISLNKDNEPWFYSYIVIELWQNGEKVGTFNPIEGSPDYVIEGVSNGTYDIYTTDSTGNISKTNLIITVDNNDVEDEIDYYTLTLARDNFIEKLYIEDTKGNKMETTETSISKIFREGEEATINADVIEDGEWVKWIKILGNDEDTDILNQKTTIIMDSQKTFEATGDTNILQCFIEYYLINPNSSEPELKDKDSLGSYEKGTVIPVSATKTYHNHELLYIEYNSDKAGGVTEGDPGLSTVDDYRVDKDHTVVKAFYTPLPCKLTYFMQGGSYGEFTTEYEEMHLAYTDVELITPVRDDYTFTGWYEDIGEGYSGYVGPASFTITKDTVLNATWTETKEIKPLDIVANPIYGDVVAGSQITVSATAFNNTSEDLYGDSSVAVTLKVTTEDGIVICEAANSEVVIPAHNKNIVYFNVDIPEKITVDDREIELADENLTFNWDITK